jgi:hypothetical protein
LALSPDIIVVATGGLPQNDAIRFGGELAKSSWDVLSADVKPSGDVLILDENGSHPALVCTEFLADQGVAVEFVTPERNFAPDAGGTNIVPYMRNFVRRGVKITTMTGVSRLERSNNRIKATLWSPFTMADCGERIVDMVVVENATVPLDDLYFALKEASTNRGEVDYRALIAAGRRRSKKIRKAPIGFSASATPCRRGTSTRRSTTDCASRRRSKASSANQSRGVRHRASPQGPPEGEGHRCAHVRPAATKRRGCAHSSRAAFRAGSLIEARNRPPTDPAQSPQSSSPRLAKLDLKCV